MATAMSLRRNLGTGDAVSLIFNALIHAVILGYIWCFLFDIVIAPLAKDTIGNELEHIIDGIVKNNITNIPIEARNFMRSNENNEVIARVKSYLKDESKATRVQNSWITGMSYAVPVTATILLAGLVGILWMLGISLPLKHILVENTITFALVGVVEILLFLNIAIKFAPIHASDLTNTILSQAKIGLNCPQK